MMTVAAGDAAEILGTSRRKVLLLCEQRIVEPTVPAVGRGSERRFCRTGLVELKIASALGDFGIAPRRLREILAIWRSQKLAVGHTDTGATAYDLFVLQIVDDAWTPSLHRHNPLIAERTPQEFTAEIERAALAFGGQASGACVVISISAIVEDVLARIDKYWQGKQE